MSQERRYGLTRRALIGGAAAAGAAAVARPAAGLATTLEPGGGAFSRRVGTLQGASPVLAAPRRFALVGVEWAGAGPARIDLRARRRDGGWSPWLRASTAGHDPDGRPDRLASFGEPIWIGAADYVQLRSHDQVDGVRLHFVTAQRQTRARVAGTFPLATPTLDAGPGQPPIIARAAWAQGHAPPAVAPHYGSVELAFVHHSESANGYSAAQVPAILRSIFDYHRYVRGYWDIAYNFAVDDYGRIWEARAGGIDEPVLGAHAGGYNAVSTGIVVLGSFMSVTPPPAAIQALEQLLAWKLSLHGVPTQGRVKVRVDPAAAFYTRFAPGAIVSLPRVAGHRDGDATECPGTALYSRLPAVRRQVAALAGTAVRLSVLATPAAPLAGQAVALTGRLIGLDGQPLAGAPIELQQVARAGARTLAAATTAADGSWSTSVTVTTNALLRALHAPAPASVSNVLHLGVAPAVTLGLDSISPLRVSGTINPPKRHVTLRIYRLGAGHRRLVKAKRVVVRQGRFAAGLPTRRPGRYQVVAVTAADAGNVAGASPPLAVTLT